MSLLSRCRARSSMLRCLSVRSHKCCDAWPNSSGRVLADADGHLRLTTDPTSEQGLHDLSRMGLWASTALATAILWAQKPEERVKCNAWADFSNTDNTPLVFDCPCCGTRNAHEGHRYDLHYGGRLVWCQNKGCHQELRIKRPCHARTHSSIGRTATGLGLLGAAVCPPLAVGAGLTGGIYKGTMAVVEDKPGDFFKNFAGTVSLGLLQVGDHAASAIAHTINAAQAIHGLIEASKKQSNWLDVTLSIVSMISSTVQIAQSLDQAAIRETEEALEAASKQVSNLGREVQQGGPIQHGAQINGKLFKNLQQAATARDQINVMYDHQLMSLQDKDWLLEKLKMLNKLGKKVKTAKEILSSIEELKTQKANVVVQRN